MQYCVDSLQSVFASSAIYLQTNKKKKNLYNFPKNEK